MPRHPDRVRPLQGATNFRDLGGYAGHESRPVRWGVLYRSDHLAGLTPADQAQVRALGVRRAFDFRGVHERAATPYEVPGVTQHALSIEPTVTQRMDAMVAAGQTLTGDAVAGLMRDLYRGLVNDQSHRFAELFEHLLAEDTPLVFHCTAGKDRTGIAAALILQALGVPRDVVMQDYLLTNEHFRHPPVPHTSTPKEALAVLWRVQEDFLTEALRAIDQDHGGIERYLTQRLGLSEAARATLRARYLQSA
jgi:protein-tyrosine phosphatase